jgi:type I restriction enzyme S subunit
MIANLKPYTGYKASDLPWLKQVPAHWELIPNRGLVRRRKVLVGERHTDYRLLSLTKQGVIVRDISTGKGKFSSDMGTSQEVRGGDLVFCLFDVPETPRTVGLSRQAGMITGAYTVFESLGRSNSEYFELFYQAMDDRKLLSPLYSGLRHTIPAARFLGTKSPLPPLEEQEAIVRFLAWANGRVERAIRSKRKVIALLNEQKQAIIHKAVTLGLDSNVALKPSGVPWLGDIPAHWEVRRLRASVTDCVNGLWGTDPGGESDITCVRVADFDRKNLRVSLLRKTTRSIPTSARTRRLLKTGDLLLEKSGGGDKQPVGAVVMYDHDEPAVCSNFVARLAIARGYEPRFLNYLHCALYARRMNVPSIKQTTGIQNLDGKSYLSERAGFPPLDEQQKIAAFLDAECLRFVAAMSRIEDETKLLKEYRTRLMADVVTGKLDVREAAAKLPDDIPVDATTDVDLGNEIENLEEETGE